MDPRSRTIPKKAMECVLANLEELTWLIYDLLCRFDITLGDPMMNTPKLSMSCFASLCQ